MITKQELIDIMKEGWQPTGYYSVDFNANMVADKILEKIKKDLEELERIKKVLRIYGLADLKDTCDLLDTRLEEDLKCFTNLLKYGKKTIKQVEKDLEILEIFKKNTDVELLKANENAPIFATILRVKPLTNTIDKEYQKVKEWLNE